MSFEIRIFSMNYYIGRKKLPRYFACIYLISDIFWFPLFLFRLMFFILPQSRAIRFLFRIRELKSPRNSKVGWVECKAFFSFCKTFAIIHLKLVWMCFIFTWLLALAIQLISFIHLAEYSRFRAIVMNNRVWLLGVAGLEKARLNSGHGIVCRSQNCPRTKVKKKVVGRGLTGWTTSSSLEW